MSVGRKRRGGGQNRSRRLLSLKLHDLNGHPESFTSPPGLLCHTCIIFFCEIPDVGLARNDQSLSRFSKAQRGTRYSFLFGPM